MRPASSKTAKKFSASPDFNAAAFGFLLRAAGEVEA
jgi:hypothetical protein